MCNGEHRPTPSPRVVATVAFPTFESTPVGRASLLELRAGSCRDRFGEDVCYVQLSGELDAFTASQIGEPLSGITRLAGDLVIDTRLVSFIDSAGLRLLEDMFDRGAANYSSVWLHDPSRAVKRLMFLAGVDETLATCTTGHTGDDDRRDASISGCPPATRSGRG